MSSHIWWSSLFPSVSLGLPVQKCICFGFVATVWHCTAKILLARMCCLMNSELTCTSSTEQAILLGTIKCSDSNYFTVAIHMLVQQAPETTAKNRWFISKNIWLIHRRMIWTIIRRFVPKYRQSISTPKLYSISSFWYTFYQQIASLGVTWNGLLF